MKNAIFSFTTPNLGDEIQSIAVSALLPAVHSYVDRDALDKVRLDEPHQVIMNSWFAIKRLRAVPHRSLFPVYFGFCVGRPELINSSWIKQWNRHSYVGCRDTHSRDLLVKNDIKARHTGCLTTWLGTFIDQPKVRSEVLFIDVPPSVEHVIPSKIRDQAIRLTNETSKDGHPKDRFRAAAAILDRMRNAKLVVTRRLHVALPCVGFKTPCVTFLDDQPKNAQRFSGTEPFLTIVRHGDGFADAWRDPEPLEPTVDLNDGFERLKAFLGTKPRMWNSVAELADTLPDVPRHSTSAWTRLIGQRANFRAVPFPPREPLI